MNKSIYGVNSLVSLTERILTFGKTNELTSYMLLFICIEYMYINYDRQGQPSSIEDWNHTRHRRVLVIYFLNHTYENVDTK